MGNTPQTILFNCGSKYIGQTANGIPNGRGILYIHKKSLAANHSLLFSSDGFALVQSHFENGKLRKCILKLKNGFTFHGTLNQNLQLIEQGKLFDDQKVQYEGTFEKGRLIKGKIDSSKSQLSKQVAYICLTQGQFIGTSIISGESTYYNITEQYLVSGQFYKGKIQRGFYFYSQGDLYQGEFSQGRPNGNGTYSTGQFTIQSRAASNNLINSNLLVQQFQKKLNQNSKQTHTAFKFSGNFQNGNPNGKGELKFGNNHTYKGQFKDGKIHSKGEYRFPDGTVYKGSFYYGSMTGDSVIEFNQNSLINQNKNKNELLQMYEGEVSEGIFHGLGILYYANGVIFKGYFLNGAKNGPGVLIYCQNKYKCLYMMNMLVEEIKLITE